MGISIVKDDVGIKFYLESPLEDGDVEPSAVIYNSYDSAIVNEKMVSNRYMADQLSQLIGLVGVFVHSLQENDDDRKKKIFDVIFMHKLLLETKEGRYSADQVLRYLYSNKIVTVNKTNRVRFQFVSFGLKNDKIFIIYNPVIW